MKITKTLFVLVVLLTCLGSVGFGYSMSNSNLDMFGYPSLEDKAFAPMKPHSNDGNMAKSYADQVRNFREDARKYISAANGDIRDIESKKREAERLLREVNREYDEYTNSRPRPRQ